MAGSNFIQVSPYLLVEYVYGDDSTKFLGTEYKPAKLINDHDNYQITFLNTNPSRNNTENVLDYSAVNLGGVDWVILDKDVPVPYISQDDKLHYEDMSSSLGSLLIMYDTVRFHFQSGYNFDNIEGLLFQLSVREAQSGLFSYLTSNFILKGTDRIRFNSNPIFITDRIYDRFIEIMVPSVKDTNNAFYSDPSNSLSIGYQYTTQHKGFQFETQIYVKVSEIVTLSKRNGITFFKTDQNYEVAVRQEDIYSDVTAVIREATDGDYFEYFTSYQGGFPELLIEELNSQGGSYVIIHQIDVIEQVDTRFVTTCSFTQIQNGSFESPLTFRPILKYAGISPSFSIEYTSRVYNTENGYQILKKSYTTSFNPSKYGKNTERIGLSFITSPLKVYNKVYGGANITHSSVLPTNNFNTVYVPVFYDSMSLFIGNYSVLAAGQDPLDPNFHSNSVYFGQSAARLYLGEFEQYVKFSVKQYSTRSNALINVDLSALTMLIGFEDNNGKIFTYPALPSTIESPFSQGEVVFRILSDTKRRMGIDGSVVKSFYLLSETTTGAQTKMYVGTVDIDSNMSAENDRIKALGSQAVTLESLASTGASAVNAAGIDTLQQDLGIANQNNSLINQLGQMSNASVTGRELDNQSLPTSIPGFTTDTNAQSINAIVPTGK